MGGEPTCSHMRGSLKPAYLQSHTQPSWAAHHSPSLAHWHIEILKILSCTGNNSGFSIIISSSSSSTVIVIVVVVAVYLYINRRNCQVEDHEKLCTIKRNRMLHCFCMDL